MQKYVLNLVASKDENTAMFKAKNDVANILKNEGYKSINYTLYEKSKLKKSIAMVKLLNYCRRIQDGVVIYQYPLGQTIDNKLSKLFSKKNRVKTIAFIHDLYSLQFNTNILEEINKLEKFDGIIAHNDKMASWLKENGISKPIISLEVFDYVNNHYNEKKYLNDSIVFAGNLSKAGFLNKLDIKTIFDVYGPSASESYPPNVNYKGVVSPDKLSDQLQDKFGLIWDGNSLEECNGIKGEYEKYNNPHKLSLYLSSGIPVIAWEKAAIGSFIEKEQVGITINSLDEIDKIMSTMNNEDYKKIQENTQRIGKALRNGHYTKRAISKILEKL